MKFNSNFILGLILYFFFVSICAEEVKVSEKEYQIRVQAQELLDKGKASDAIAVLDGYEKSLKVPMHFNLYEFRGSIWAMSEKYENALKDYLKAYRLQKTRENVSGLGLCYLYTNDFFNAESVFREGMLAFDENLHFKKGLLQCFLRQERYREAVSLSESLLIKAPLDKELLSLAGQIYRQLGENEKAWENFTLLYLQGNAPKKDLESLIDIALIKKLNLMAEKYADEIIARKEEVSKERISNLVISFLQMNQTEKAEKWIAIASKQGKTEKLTLYLAEALRVKDPTRSLSLMNSIKDLSEMDGRYYLVLGDLILKTGDHKKASAHFREAATFEHYRSLALWQLFALHRTEKNNKECLAILLDLQQLEPENQTISQFLSFYQDKNEDGKK